MKLKNPSVRKSFSFLTLQIQQLSTGQQLQQRNAANKTYHQDSSPKSFRFD